MSVTDRDHLSIGEVLALLQAEFPDVTISKIRFLESQGLIDPERTPSGYRKFYENDIARLRWILAQQRDHFLPLKVIKDRLEESDVSGVPLTDPVGPAVSEAEPELVTEEPAAAPQPEPIVEQTPAAEQAPAPEETPERSPAAGELPAAEPEPAPAASPRPGAPQARARLNVFASTPGRSRPAPAVGPSDAASGASEPSVPPTAPVGPRSGAGRARQAVAAAAGPPATTRPESEVPVADDAVAAASPAAGGRSPSRKSTDASSGAGRRRRTGAASGGPFADLSSVSFTLDELAAAVGMTTAQLEELERFGLIASRALSQGRRYGDDAVLVAKLAQRFGAYGIEARHLRMFRVAVDRELALYEQVVAPLARQRAESGEQRVAQLWADLDQLGADLRDALFRRSPS